MAEHQAEGDAIKGDAYGDDPRYHQIARGMFICSAPADAKCRTIPTCDCENWCCCDDPEEQQEHAGDNGHCCMTTVQAGCPCWIEPWIQLAGIEDSYHDNAIRFYDEADEEELGFPDGPVVCDWDDGVRWRYALVGADLANLSTPPGGEGGGDCG